MIDIKGIQYTLDGNSILTKFDSEANRNNEFDQVINSSSYISTSNKIIFDFDN